MKTVNTEIEQKLWKFIELVNADESHISIYKKTKKIARNYFTKEECEDIENEFNSKVYKLADRCFCWGSDDNTHDCACYAVFQGKEFYEEVLSGKFDKVSRRDGDRGEILGYAMQDLAE